MIGRRELEAMKPKARLTVVQVLQHTEVSLGRAYVADLLRHGQLWATWTEDSQVRLIQASQRQALG